MGAVDFPGSIRNSQKIKWPYLRLHTTHTLDFWYGKMYRQYILTYLKNIIIYLFYFLILLARIISFYWRSVPWISLYNKLCKFRDILFISNQIQLQEVNFTQVIRSLLPNFPDRLFPDRPPKVVFFGFLVQPIFRTKYFNLFQ